MIEREEKVAFTIWLAALALAIAVSVRVCSPAPAAADESNCYTYCWTDIAGNLHCTTTCY